MHPPSKRPRAILFDHDGVLVASEPLHWAAWEKLSGEIGIPYDPVAIREWVGKTAPQILSLLMAKHRPDWDGNPDQAKTWINRKNEIYLEEARGGLKTYPGVLEGLRWMRANGIRSGVVSNARDRELRAVLEILGLAPWMDTIVSRESAGAPKPDPRPYLLGAENLETDPGDCMAVEDSPPGLEAALLAGIPTAAVLTNFAQTALTSPVPGRPDLHPCWIGASLADFFKMIQSL